MGQRDLRKQGRQKFFWQSWQKKAASMRVELHISQVGSLTLSHLWNDRESLSMNAARRSDMRQARARRADLCQGAAACWVFGAAES
jgi:hypothetical protein